MLIDKGKPSQRRGFVIRCSKCDKTAVLPLAMQKLGNHESDCIAATKRAERDGWFVGNGPARDLCPSCIEEKSRAPVLTIVKDEQMEQKVAAEPPREMGRDERRIIYSKLNDVYLNDKEGYAPPWTDQKVADDLGCPRAWVATVRDEMFGPVASNPEIDGLIKDAERLLADATGVAQAMRGTCDGHRKMLDRLDGQIADTCGQITLMERRLRELIAAVRP
jgi:hypothetical protein